MSKFNQFSFDPRIQAGITRVGFTDPTPIQKQAIPVVMKGDDVLGLAQTGTGKTAAFMLPILERLTRGPLRRIRALVLAPTRELAEQIHQATIAFSVNMNVRSMAIYGGVSKVPQISALRQGTEIVVACPGRLLDLIGDGQVNLSNVEVFVLDEADRMCDMGFLPDVLRIVKRLPEKRQSLFFSATMPRDARQLANTILRNPVTVQIGMTAPVKTVSHALYPVHHQSKKKLLLELLHQTATGRVLIFTRTKYRARNLAQDLDRKGFRVAALQGNMSQNQRQQAMDGFRKGKFDLLVATDIAARGIDVTEITHVINFDMPDTVDAYTHRIGRTGRAQETGEAFTFATPDDGPMVHSIEQLLGYRINRHQLDGFEYEKFEVGNPPIQKNSNGSTHRATTPQGNRMFRRRRSNRKWQTGDKSNSHTQRR
ncbi:MAG TPA: DEAD/DEAH box helicase [Anaerolineales bacterium]|nr:DEAD/DEAH box helicase [Anaerolineales bacterium]